jgi:lipid-binding SYLF domain-containing protein
MTRLSTWLGASLLLSILGGSSLRAGEQELKTVHAAAETVQALSEIPLKGIPRSLMHDTAAVAIVPRTVRAGLLVDARFGRGVLLIHESEGRWSNPVFISLTGGGIGGEVGFEKTELVLVFKTRKSADRALRGKLTLGTDVAIAAGPIGREAEAATDRPLRTEIYSYSRSRGLFVGLLLEGTRLQVDDRANEAFYHIRDWKAADILGRPDLVVPVAETLKARLAKLSGPACPPVLLIPFGPQPLPAYPVPLPPAPGRKE